MNDPRGNPIQYFHAHVYFEVHQITEAHQLRESALKKLTFRRKISPLIERKVGPHPLPMFEIDFEARFHPEMIQFLEKNRGNLSVLVHPVTPDEIWNHTLGAKWLGTPLPLYMKFLEDFMQGEVAGIHDTLPFTEKRSSKP